MSKKGFLFGLAVGTAAIATIAMKMDEDQKAALKAKAQQGLADFKDRAIDYAFYANDAAEDFKAEASQHFEEARGKVADFADQYQAAKEDDNGSFSTSLDAATDSLRSELAKADDDEGDEANDDIVIDSAAAFGDSDQTAPASDEERATDTPESAADDKPSSDDDQPTK